MREEKTDHPNQSSTVSDTGSGLYQNTITNPWVREVTITLYTSGSQSPTELDSDPTLRQKQDVGRIQVVNPVSRTLDQSTWKTKVRGKCSSHRSEIRHRRRSQTKVGGKGHVVKSRVMGYPGTETRMSGETKGQTRERIGGFTNRTKIRTYIE